MTTETGACVWLEDVADLVRLDLLQFFRNKMIVVSTLLTSVSMLLAFGLGTTEMPGPAGTHGSYFDFILPGIVGVGIMFSCTYTIGYAFIVDCQRRTIEDIVMSPLSYAGFIVGRLVGTIVKCSFQFLLVLIVAVVKFDAPIASNGQLLFGFVTEGLFFSGLGILVATFTNEISFANLINLVLIPLTYFCGVFFPLAGFEQGGGLIAVLPLSVYIDVIRDATTGGASSFVVASHWLAVCYALMIILVALYAFRARVQQG
jgi:ABC-2 type transport system permease protein